MKSRFRSLRAAARVAMMLPMLFAGVSLSGRAAAQAPEDEVVRIPTVVGLLEVPKRYLVWYGQSFSETPRRIFDLRFVFRMNDLSAPTRARPMDVVNVNPTPGSNEGPEIIHQQLWPSPTHDEWIPFVRMFENTTRWDSHRREIHGNGMYASWKYENGSTRTVSYNTIDIGGADYSYFVGCTTPAWESDFPECKIQVRWKTDCGLRVNSIISAPRGDADFFDRVVIRTIDILSSWRR